jgi:putative toxin-antitoxin system antitoxin component (TIGR02293 family)
LRCRGWAIENETVLDRAEILAKASATLGLQEDAERWLQTPGIGLNRQRPIDHLATRAGAEIVENFLSQLEYGVYV